MQNYFKNKRILITGIKGFVGTHLEKRLSILGANVYGISRSDEKDKKIFKENVLDYQKLNQIIKDLKIETCFHLAGESLVENGQEDPYHTFKINTEGTLNILESGRINNLEKIIIASTSHVYGNNKLPYLEEYNPIPSRPYETSKACADLIAKCYSGSFRLPVLIPRFVNIYGPGDLNFDRIIPKTIKSILENHSPKMWGGEAVRDYLYIDDAIDAYIKLAEINLNMVGNNRIFNFGTGNLISVKALIKKIIKVSGRNFEIEKINDERESEIKSQYVSWKKAEKILNWKPKVNLDQGLKKSFLWYKTQ